MRQWQWSGKDQVASAQRRSQTLKREGFVCVWMGWEWEWDKYRRGRAILYPQTRTLGYGIGVDRCKVNSKKLKPIINYWF